jgi:hypothetical protein
MLENACLLNDPSFLPNLFDVDAVLLAPRTNRVGGCPAIANVVITPSSKRAFETRGSGRSANAELQPPAACLRSSRPPR